MMQNGMPRFGLLMGAVQAQNLLRQAQAQSQMQNKQKSLMGAAPQHNKQVGGMQETQKQKQQQPQQQQQQRMGGGQGDKQRGGGKDQAVNRYGGGGQGGQQQNQKIGSQSQSAQGSNQQQNQRSQQSRDFQAGSNKDSFDMKVKQEQQTPGKGRTSGETGVGQALQDVLMRNKSLLGDMDRRQGQQMETDDRRTGQSDRMQMSSAYQQNKLPLSQRLGAKEPQPPAKRFRPLRYNDKIRDRVDATLSGPQIDLEPMDTSEKKFNARGRLFVGNLPRDVSVSELKEMFKKFGEVGQIYINKDYSYSFVSLDYRGSAEKAVKELQNFLMHGRPLKVRFASITSGITVKNLSPTVSNELLCKSFEVFGPIDSCRVSVDDRGKPSGEGTVIFSDKKSALMAYKKCQEECYFLTGGFRPIIVEPLETKEEDEGLPEGHMLKNDQYRKERQIGPHFATLGSFEDEYGQRYMQLFQMFKEKKQLLERDFLAELDQLDVKMELARHAYETEQLRRELAQREAESSYLQTKVEMRTQYYGTGTMFGFGSSQTGSSTNVSGSHYDNYGDNRSQQMDRTFDSFYDRRYDTSYDSTSRGYDSVNRSYERTTDPFDRSADRTFDEVSDPPSKRQCY